MGWKVNLRACLIPAMLLPGAALALVVEVQGVRLEPDLAGASCVDISGVYPGVRIESDQPGQRPRVCHSSTRINAISIVNSTLVALSPARRDVVIRYEHEFPPGVNGKIMARARLQGFFAASGGVDIPTGDRLEFKAYFAQGRLRDPIAEPFTLEVADTMDSAIFDFSVKRPYLASGPRALKAELRVNFAGVGHKLTLPEKNLVMLDTGGRFEDKLEAMEAAPGAEEEAAPGDAGAPGAEQGAAAPGQEKDPDAPKAPEEPPASKVPPLPPLPPLNPLPQNPL